MSHAAFLTDICAHPDDDAPRLIYADWLEEQGGADNEARAEFIRVQCQIASTPPLPLLPPLANPRLVRDAEPIRWNDTTPDDYRIRAVYLEGDVSERSLPPEPPFRFPPDLSPWDPVGVLAFIPDALFRVEIRDHDDRLTFQSDCARLLWRQPYRGGRVRVRLHLLPDDVGAAARTNGLRRRATKLLGRHGVAWAGPAAAPALDWQWSRGFIEEISLPGSLWLEHGDDLVRRAPLRRVQLTTWTAQDIQATWARCGGFMMIGSTFTGTLGYCWPGIDFELPSPEPFRAALANADFERFATTTTPGQFLYTRNQAPSLSRKPTIPEVLPRFVAYHALPENGAWGSLHIVLEDGNVSDGSVQHCLEWAQERGDTEGEALARVLLQMSRSQRGRIPRKVREVENRQRQTTLKGTRS